LTVGGIALACAQCVELGQTVKAYLRPEDIVARPIVEGDENVIDTVIEKIEFLGSYCLVRVMANGLPMPLTVYLSLNFLAEQSLAQGSRLKLRILTERLRLFGS
jgi:iron(III) transport system ATP-binding protein